MRHFFLLIIVSFFSLQLFSQTVKPDIEFKNSKQVGDKLNIYFDISLLTDSSQISTISNAIEQNSEIISCRIYKSSYGTYRCGSISTLIVDAVAIRKILLENNVDYDFKSVRINNKKIISAYKKQ